MPCDTEGHCGSIRSFERGGANYIRTQNEAADQANAQYSHWAPPDLAHPRAAGGGGGHSSGGTYSSYQCGRFGLSCSNFDPKKAVPKSSGFNLFHWAAHTAVPWAIHVYEHNTLVNMAVNGLIVSAAIALCPETAGLTCGVAVGFVAGGATRAFTYQVSRSKHSAGGYASAFVIGGIESAIPQASYAGAVKWAAPLTLTQGEKILLRNPIIGGNATGSALFWAKAGFLWLGIKSGKW